MTKLAFPSLLLAKHPAVDIVGNGAVQCTGPNSQLYIQGHLRIHVSQFCTPQTTVFITL